MNIIYSQLWNRLHSVPFRVLVHKYFRITERRKNLSLSKGEQQFLEPLHHRLCSLSSPSEAAEVFMWSTVVEWILDAVHGIGFLSGSDLMSLRIFLAIYIYIYVCMYVHIHTTKDAELCKNKKQPWQKWRVFTALVHTCIWDSCIVFITWQETLSQQ